MRNILKRLWKDENGATAIEYGLIAGLISIVIAISAPGIGASLTTVFATIATKMAAAAGT
ncbi:MAG: pilus assembly protein [Rubritepida sp.]|nr:pilus assembly protein [Rubritepida sp.]